jgi:hypothetical protein
MFFVMEDVHAAISANGLRIGDGGAFEKRQPNICTNAQ